MQFNTKWNDWQTVIEKCFENREADIGRFFRRHLSNLSEESLDSLRQVATTLNQSYENASLPQALMANSRQRFNTLVTERAIELPEHGAMEVAAIVNDNLDGFRPNTDFLNLLMSSNPRFTGWPVWIDSRSLGDENSRPNVYDGKWESLIANLDSGNRSHLDYWSLDPVGHFYLYRGLQDDITRVPESPAIGEALDYGLALLRVAECIFVAIEFAKAMKADPESNLNISFRWSGLRGRQISSWAKPERNLNVQSVSHQDSVHTQVTIPLDTAYASLYTFVHSATRPLFELFEGLALDEAIVEGITRTMMERRL